MDLETQIISSQKGVLDPLRNLLAQSSGKKIHISCAYATDAGFDLVKDTLELAKSISIVVGTPNVTSLSVIKRLKDLGAEVRLADNDMIGNIFHTKLYYGEHHQHDAWAMIGSVNLTQPALTTNRELAIVLQGHKKHPTLLEIQKEIIFNTSDHVSLPATPYLLRLLKRSKVKSNQEIVEALKTPDLSLPIVETEERTDTGKAFIQYVTDTRMTQSYKPVLLITLLKHVDDNGFISHGTLIQEFRQFYIDRKKQGLVIEKNRSRNPTPFLEPEQVTETQVWTIISRYPLPLMDALVEQVEGGIQFLPEVWAVLTDVDKAALYEIARQRLEDYYNTV